MTLNCFKCGQEVVFDSEHIGKNGKKIPLDPDNHAPHNCPMRDQNKEPYTLQQAKDDHGNETVYDMTNLPAKPPTEYVDHTAVGIAQIKTFTAPTNEILDKDANEWLLSRGNTIRFRGGQFQMTEKGCGVALWYEETA